MKIYAGFNHKEQLILLPKGPNPKMQTAIGLHLIAGLDGYTDKSEVKIAIETSAVMHGVEIEWV